MYQVAADPTPRPRPRDPREVVGPLGIELEIPCSRCGYALSGLRTDGKCPECGAAITPSVFGDKLEYAAPGYVRLLRIGATMAEIAVAAQLACTVPTILLLIVTGIASTGSPPMWLQGTAMFTLFVMPGLAGGAALAGWWMLSTPDPALAEVARNSRWRRRLRAVLLVEAACWMVLVGFGLINLLPSIPPSVYVPFAAAAGIVLPFAMLAHLVLSAFYFREMSGRSRTEFAGHVFRYQTIGAIGAAGLILLFAMAIYAETEGLAMVLFLTAFVVLIGLAGVHIWMLEIFRRAAREAMAVQRRSSCGGAAR